MNAEEFLAQWTVVFGAKWACKTTAVRHGVAPALSFNELLWANVRSGNMEMSRKAYRDLRGGAGTGTNRSAAQYRIKP